VKTGVWEELSDFYRLSISYARSRGRGRFRCGR